MSSRRRVKALVGILFRMLLRADGTSEIRTADPETLYHLGHWSEDLVQQGVWKPLPPEGPPFPSYRGHPQGVFTGPWVLGRVLIHSNQPRIRCDYRTPPHVPALYNGQKPPGGRSLKLGRQMSKGQKATCGIRGMEWNCIIAIEPHEL